MTQSNLLELAQQGDPQAIAALMNQSLQPRGMTATVERAGDRLSVLLEADQVPNRQTLTAFVHRGISNLGIESIRSVKVLGQQTGTNLPVWTQDLTLELPTTAAEAIDAVDLSSSVDFMADLSLTDDADADDELEALWIAPSDEQSQDSLADLLAVEPADDLQGLFDDQPEALEAGIGVDNPLEALRSMFGEQSDVDFPPLEESSFNGANLNSMDAVETNSLQDLLGEDLEEDPLSELDGVFSESTFTESNLESNLGLGNDLGIDLNNDLGSDLGNDLSDDLGLESSDSDSLAELFGDRAPEEDQGMFEETPPNEEEFQDLFGETASGTASEAGELEGLLEPLSPEAIAPETWLQLHEALPSEPTEESKADNQLMNSLGEEPSVIGEEPSLSNTSSPAADDQLISFSDEELSPNLSFLEESSPDLEESSPEGTLLSDLAEEDSLLDFFDRESEQSEDLLSERFAGVETEVSEPLLFDEPRDEPVSSDNIESFNEPLLFNEPRDEPISSDNPELVDEPLLFNEPLLFDEPRDEPVSSDNLESVNEPLLFDEPRLFNEPRDEPVSFDNPELVDEPLLFDEVGDEPVSFDSLESVDEPMSFSEPESSAGGVSSGSSKSFQEQQALADFFADDPLADFLAPPIQPSGEEFLEDGLSEPMAAATAQDYFNSPEPNIDFQTEHLNSVPPVQPELEDDQDFQFETFQPAPEPTDLFSERMEDLEAEFPQDFRVDPTDQLDRDFSGNDDRASLDNWDEALENPLPDVEIHQTDTISSLESLTDHPDLDDPERTDLQTEAVFEESSFDRHSEAEPDTLQESQPDRWDLDSDDELTVVETPLLPAVGTLGRRRLGADALEDLTVSLPNLPDDDYEQQVAYPSLNDPTQAPPQPKRSPWVFPLVLFGLIGWILALIGLSYWLKERDTTPPPIVQPSTGSPDPAIPPAPLAPASPSSALPGAEDSAALPKSPDWMAVD
jgi:hypothetical protein